jgi:hypothetical protein
MMKTLIRKMISRKEASNLLKESSSFVKSLSKARAFPELSLISFSNQVHELVRILKKHMGVNPRQILLLKCTSHARKPEKQIIGFVC